MRDAEVRALERVVRATPDDAAAWGRYVQALDRAGGEPPDEVSFRERVRRVRSCLFLAPHEVPLVAFIEIGDEVWVEEQDAPKIVGRWRGRVRRLDLEKLGAPGRDLASHVFHVRPLALDDDEPEIAWRTSPRAEWLRAGLEVRPPLDRVELIARGPSTPRAPAQ